MSIKQRQQLRNMQRSLKYFTRSITQSPLKKDIFKIILYGSLVDKDIHAGSDIDVAVIAKHPKRIENKIDELSYDALLEYGELIEPIIYSTAQYKKLRSPFLMKILQEGKEIYAK